MVKFLQILAYKTPTAGGRLWRGQTWIGWMSATIRDGSWSKFLKGRAGEDAGAAHGSTEKAAEEPGRTGSFLLVLSVPLSFTLSKMLLKRWATASSLPVIRGKKPAVRHGLTSAARQVEEGGWRSLSQAGGQEGAAKLPRKQVIPPALLAWQITLPVCSAAQSYLPRLLSPGGDTGTEPGALCQVFTLVHYLINV